MSALPSPLARPAGPRRLLRRAVLALALAATTLSCAAVNDLLAADPKRALEDQAGPGTCCVSHQFFECPSGSATLACGGNPIQQATCADDCGPGNAPCVQECVAKYAPNPSECKRAEARDSECHN